MTEKKRIYRCEHCGIIVEVLHEGGGKMICCDTPMVLQEEKTADAPVEKHVPIIEKLPEGYRVTVGTTLHPMENDHFIEWIELIADGESFRHFLSPGDKPTATFRTKAESVSAREYCNKHGLWKT